MNTAIVIPAYNEGTTIGHVVEQVAFAGTVVVVDDCSTDATASIAEKHGATVVRNAVNLGYDGALDAGFRYAVDNGFDAVITFDADGQHDAGLLPSMLGPIERDEADMVIGIRPEPARFGEWLFNLYTRLRFGVPDILCGMKAYRLSLYRSLGWFDRDRMIGTDLALASLRAGARTLQVEVPVHDRADASRFGSRFRANMKILRALLLAVRKDVLG